MRVGCIAASLVQPIDSMRCIGYQPFTFDDDDAAFARRNKRHHWRARGSLHVWLKHHHWRFVRTKINLAVNFGTSLADASFLQQHAQQNISEAARAPRQTDVQVSLKGNSDHKAGRVGESDPVRDRR